MGEEDLSYKLPFLSYSKGVGCQWDTPSVCDLDHLAEVLFVSSVDWKLLCLPLSTLPSLEASH